ncbi:MAG: biopolymer transporter ExbD [Gilvibacter sp.]
MRHSRELPTMNAGSMADIAFLLLIFFLVATTVTQDQGIYRKLPAPCPPGQVCDVDINKRNILSIAINNDNQLFVNQMITNIDDLKSTLMEFIDNNGDSSCDYCLGSKLPFASENPQKAAIALITQPKSTYNTFIEVQDELTAAYFELRAAYASKRFNKNLAQLTASELAAVKQAYPFRITEADIR